MSRPYSNESAFQAVAHRTRRRILDQLLRGEASAGELASALNISMRNLSPHLAVLRTAGLIVQRRRGTYRLFMLAPKDLQAIIMWVRPYERVMRGTRR